MGTENSGKWNWSGGNGWKEPRLTRLEKYLQNEAAIQNLEQELEFRKKRRRAVESELIEELIQEGSSKVSFQGQTLFLRTGYHLTASPGTTTAAVSRIMIRGEPELRAFVGFKDTDRLAALLNANPAHQELVQGMLGVYKTHHLRSRKQNG